MRRRFFEVLVLAAAVIPSALAADTYLVRFGAEGRHFTVCETIVWADDAIFYNAGATPATVRILGVSNGPALTTTPDHFVLLPQSAVSLNDVLGAAWSIPGLSTMHLDVPEHVYLTSRDTLAVRNGCTMPLPLVAVGETPLPVFRGLTPPDEVQVHLATNLGGAASRINVAIYNAGTRPAAATITVHRVCDGSVVDQLVTVVPADTTIQFGGLATGPSVCTTSETSAPWRRYTTVVVDQPSLSYVSNITETPPSRWTGLVPAVDLAIAHTTKY